MGLFGTDGVRGVAGEFLTAELATALGAAATSISPAEAPQVLIVRDTRESGEMLEAALAAGVSSAGGHALLGGVLPTPGAALLVRRYGFDLAAVVSASHNPYAGQRHQVLRPRGHQAGRRPGGARWSGSVHEHRPTDAIGRVRDLHGAAGDYVRELETRFAGLDLSGRQDPARLRQRRDLPGRAGDLPAARRRPRADRGGSGRPEHQPRLRLHARRTAGGARGRGRLRHRLRARRRRRPRAGGGPQRARWWTGTS